MFPLKDDNPLRSTPVMTLLIIGANLLVFVWQLGQGPTREYGLLAFAMVPRALAETFGLDVPPLLDPTAARLYLAYDPPLPVPATVVTSMFLHGGWLHLLGNMWSLWIFGNNVEDEIGPGGFLVFYLTSGVSAAITQAAVNPGSPVPMVGASGAIAGVLGAYLLRFPKARILTVVPLILAWVVWIPAGVWLVVWFVGQILSSLGGGTGVAWYAHIGGFVAGMLLGPVFMGARRRRVPTPRLR
ncbi:MAG TPA: rhomboid family intramembrane serine protease [Thermodesulfobacteriota bacterium]